MIEKYNAPDQVIFGGPRDRSYPAPVEMLHLSINHVGPGIDDLVKFYQVVLNMRFVFRFAYANFEFISLSHDDENHRLGIVNVLADVPEEEGRLAPQRGCRLEHSTWKYHDFEAILLTARRIHDELGIWPRSARHGGWELTMDYEDPDGNRVELLCHMTSKAETLFALYQQYNTPREQMQYSEVYLPLSMEKLVGLYESGVPVSDLQNREYCRPLIEAGNL